MVKITNLERFLELLEREVEVIPKVPSSFLTMQMNCVYGKGGGYTDKQRYETYKQGLKHKQILISAELRVNGQYHYMSEPSQSSSKTMLQLEMEALNREAKPYNVCVYSPPLVMLSGYKFCPYCGRKLK